MTEAAPVLEHRGAVLNLDDATLTYQRQQIDLTKNEFRILRVLLENKGKVVERAQFRRHLHALVLFGERHARPARVGGFVDRAVNGLFAGEERE